MSTYFEKRLKEYNMNLILHIFSPDLTEQTSTLNNLSTIDEDMHLQVEPSPLFYLRQVLTSPAAADFANPQFWRSCFEQGRVSSICSNCSSFEWSLSD